MGMRRSHHVFWLALLSCGVPQPEPPPLEAAAAKSQFLEGGTVYWKHSHPIALDPSAPFAELVVRAPPDHPVELLIEAKARIGAKSVTLMEEAHEFTPDQLRVLRVPLAAALTLDPLQKGHATQLYAEVSVLQDGKVNSFRQTLPSRYLAHEGSAWQLLSKEALLSRYPGGVTETERRTALEALGYQLRADALAPSGVYLFEPSPDSKQVKAPFFDPFASVEICIRFNVDYIDRAGGDYWTSSSDKRANGVLVQVREAESKRLVSLAYANASTGCLPRMSLARLLLYEVIAYSDALVSNNNHVTLYPSPTNKTLYQSSLVDDFHPVADGTYTFTWQNDSTNVVNIFAAAAYSIQRRWGGTKDETYYLYNQDCPGSSGSCRRNEANLNGWSQYSVVYIGNGLNGNERKFIISHELGHAVSAMLSPRKRPPPDRDTSLTDGFFSTACATGSGHTFVSEEWQSGAIYEGFAQYYAATVWNNGGQFDCDFYYYRTLDLSPRDGVNDSPATPGVTGAIYSCESGRDMIQTCYDEDGSQQLLATGTELDWLRFFWDLQTNGGVSFGKLANIWRDADPDNWTSLSLFADLRAAAAGRGVSNATWDSWASFNGVDH